jgi:hypothetical protein
MIFSIIHDYVKGGELFDDLTLTNSLESTCRGIQSLGRNGRIEH